MIRRSLSSILSRSIFRSKSVLTPLQLPFQPLKFLENLNPNFKNNGGFGCGGGLRAYSLLSLNDLRDKVPRKQMTRKGRGIGGSGKLGFEGGQTPLRRRLPKRGFKNPFSLTFQPVGLGKIAKLINEGKIDSHELITMKTLKMGLRLMGRGADQLKWPIHLEHCLSRSGLKKKGEKVDSIGHLPAPTKPIPFLVEVKEPVPS
ncbi:hypothetical protein UlMin_040747 [Ulmus minor]